MKQPVSSRPGNDAGDEQLANRVVGQRAVDDHVHAGRDQDAQRATGGQRAQRGAHRVAPLHQRRQRHRADRRGRGHRRARGRREQRAAADVGVQQAARQAPQPGRQGDVHAVGDAGAQQQFTEQHEQRNRGEQVLVLHAPDHRRDRVHEGNAVGGNAADDADHAPWTTAIGMPTSIMPIISTNADKKQSNGHDFAPSDSAAWRSARSSSSSFSSSLALLGWKSWFSVSIWPLISRRVARTA